MRMHPSLKMSVARFLRNEDGVTMLEYTILLGIITVAVIASVVFAGTWVSTKWTTLTGALP
jgi:pilus assembly protein Flp/PilA